MASAFITTPMWLQPQRHTAYKVLRRPRRGTVTPTCAATKLLVVDLQEIVRTSEQEHIKSFSERVEVDRSSSKDTTFVLFSSQSGYAASMQSIKDASLVEPDALATLDGTELYQRYYKTPDPYWKKTVQQDWQSKPVVWALGQFFKDDVDDIKMDDVSVRAVCNTESNIGEICSQVRVKLSDMGIIARVCAGEEPREITLTAAAGSVVDVVSFCQMMLKIKEDATFVFGSDNFVSSCVRGKGNVGLCGSRSEEQWDVLGGRVFVSTEVGVKALLDGVVHHAVF